MHAIKRELRALKSCQEREKYEYGKERKERKKYVKEKIWE
jgi:hypothetical protein